MAFFQDDEDEWGLQAVLQVRGQANGEGHSRGGGESGMAFFQEDEDEWGLQAVLQVGLGGNVCCCVLGTCAKQLAQCGAVGQESEMLPCLKPLG